ncbi:unnamed protein product [Allacma fusca]|uniref:Uncharacterized protein n=1 Tax=Allacma fusca TaxID=39272 RepID=A0A8J2PNE0_9HEXA|nr:unnamed protein product [Allacma fusca]
MTQLLKDLSGIPDETCPASWCNGGFLVPICTSRHAGIRMYSTVQRLHERNYIDEDWVQKGGYQCCTCGKHHDWGRQLDANMLKQQWLEGRTGVAGPHTLEYSCTQCPKS